MKRRNLPSERLRALLFGFPALAVGCEQPSTKTCQDLESADCAEPPDVRRPPACLEKVAELVGSNPYVYSVDWSPIDDYVLSGSLDTLRLLSVDPGTFAIREVASFSQPMGIFAKWSPDGRFALSASTDVRLLAVTRDPPSISELARYSGHQADIYAVAWAPDGTHALTASKDGTLRLLAVNGGLGVLEEQAIFKGHVGKVFGTAWSPSGRSALSVGEDRTLRLLDIDPLDFSIEERTEVSRVDWETSVAWPAYDRPVLTGGWGTLNQVERWAVDEDLGSIRAEGVLVAHKSGIDVIEWSHDGRRLVTGAHDDTIRLFSRVDEAFPILGTFSGWKHGVHALSWSRDDGLVILAASHGDHVVLLNVSGCL